MGSGGKTGGGRDNNRGVERGRTKQPPVSVTKPVPRSKPKPAPRVPDAISAPKAQPAIPKPTPPSTARVGFGTEVIDTAAAQAQLSARQKAITESPLAKIPTVGGVIAKVMGESNLARQKKALREGGAAIAVSGTSFAPQGQRYTEAPGMRSSPELASQRFAVGTQGGEAKQGPAGSIGKISATKPPAGSGMGYVGDVAGVVKTTDVMGVPVTTFSGQSGYGPTGVKQDKTVSEPEPKPAKPEPIEEVQPVSSTMTSTKKKRGRLGRRTAFGTRQSLINLRNV